MKTGITILLLFLVRLAVAQDSAAVSQDRLLQEIKTYRATSPGISSPEPWRKYKLVGKTVTRPGRKRHCFEKGREKSLGRQLRYCKRVNKTTDRKSRKMRDTYGTWTYRVEYVGNRYVIIEGMQAIGSRSNKTYYYQLKKE